MCKLDICRSESGIESELQYIGLWLQPLFQIRENLPQVNQKNFDRTDNRVENLEWCTNGENSLHSMYGKNDCRLRPCISTTTGKRYRSQAEAARDIGDSQSNVSRSCRSGGKRSVKGHRFVYAACGGEIAGKDAE